MYQEKNESGSGLKSGSIKHAESLNESHCFEY